MFRLIPHIAAAMLFAFAVPAWGQDKDKKDPPKPDTPKPAENKYVNAGVLNGELAHVETGKQSIRVKYTITYQEPNQGEINAAAQEQLNMQRAIARRDFNAANNHRNAMLQHQSRAISIKTKTEEVPLEAADDLQIRLLAPKPGFDEMGNIKKYTPKELAALKGKDGKFDGEFSDLMPGQLVSVQMVKPKGSGKPVKPDEASLDDNKPKASKIIVVAQPQAGKP